MDLINIKEQGFESNGNPDVSFKEDPVHMLRAVKFQTLPRVDSRQRNKTWNQKKSIRIGKSFLI